MHKNILALEEPDRDAASRALLRSVTGYSEETGTHLRRVCALAMRLGRAAGVAGADLEDLRYGSLLHDVGKSQIPDSILHKPGQLTPAELVIMRGHSEHGAVLAERAGFGPGVVSIIRHHHERFDGEGYPAGLCGEQIPLGARIIFVVDTVDTITNERRYDPARSHEIAMSELERCAGTQFDPRLARMFHGMLAEIAERRGNGGGRDGRGIARRSGPNPSRPSRPAAA